MSLQVDLVAAQLYLADAPVTHQPFQVAGGGNCFCILMLFYFCLKSMLVFIGFKLLPCHAYHTKVCYLNETKISHN